MKVICFIDGLGSGGAQRQMVNLAVGLKNRGHYVEMIAYENADFYLSKIVENNIKYTVLKSKNYLGRIFNVSNYLHKTDADAVVSFLETPNFIGCFSSIRKHKWVLVTSERNAKPHEFTEKRGKILKWFERFSDWTVCNSNAGKKLWEKYFPQYSNRLSTIYNPVVVNKDFLTEDRKPGKKRIVIAASYSTVKNPVGLVEAVNLLTDEEKEQIHIDWFGRYIPKEDGGAYDEAVELSKKYGIQNVISFNAPTSEIYKEMANSDAVALFSEVEGLPNAICEGMMLGKPILMSRMSDYETFVTPQNGFLCDANDYNSISECIRSFIALDSEQMKKMGYCSSKIANELFDLENNLNQWEELLINLVKRKSGNEN